MKAWQLLTPPGAWVPGPGLAVDASGKHCKARAPEAVAWSVAGALHRCYQDERFDLEVNPGSVPTEWHKWYCEEHGLQWPHRVCRIAVDIQGMSLETWQSIPGRTQEEVVQLLKERGL